MLWTTFALVRLLRLGGCWQATCYRQETQRLCKYYNSHIQHATLQQKMEQFHWTLRTGPRQSMKNIANVINWRKNSKSSEKR